MKSIAMLGSQEQKQTWLPAMARLEKIGAFALTEPDHGSDSIALETSARRDGDSYVINGSKKWIGNGTIADVVVVWARDTEDHQVKGFQPGRPRTGRRQRDGVRLARPPRTRRSPARRSRTRSPGGRSGGLGLRGRASGRRDPGRVGTTTDSWTHPGRVMSRRWPTRIAVTGSRPKPRPHGTTTDPKATGYRHRLLGRGRFFGRGRWRPARCPGLPGWPLGPHC